MVPISVSMLVGAMAIVSPGTGDSGVPILFVHGNGDSAALWYPTIWRFESNGYDASALFAVDMPHPSAPQNDSVRENNRSSTQDQLAFLRQEVDRVLAVTGAEKLALVGSSRGGNTIRNYILEGGGHRNVSIAILCGTPNHGVFAAPTDLENEFNGMGHFLSRLNEGSEVHPDVNFVTLRSDRNDKYAQPTGELLGLPGKPTGVSYDSPELRGAANLVLPGLDHREVAFHPRAFLEIYRAVTGNDPATSEILPEPHPVLDGIVGGYENDAATNLPVAGARVEVYEIDPRTGIRQGSVRHAVVTGDDGRWGPFRASPTAHYEIVVSARDFPTLHYYRSPFPRSSRYINLRLEPLSALLVDVRARGSAVRMSRPRGYFGHDRDRFTIGGEVPEGIVQGVPATSAAVRYFDDDSPQSVEVVFNGETIVVRTHPLSQGHVSIAEFHY